MLLRINAFSAIGFGVEKQTGTELYVSLDQLGMAPPTTNVVLRTILPPATLSRTLERLLW